jgi:molybdopterin-guanine dinucleotide biosynthesis protein A
MTGRDDITGVMLCGGDGRRMQGLEKPLQLLDGTMLVAHVRARLAPQVSPIIISANREPSTYAQWGDEVIADRTPGLGPLGGLASVIPHVRTPLLFCCPGDAPFLDGQLVARLRLALDDDAEVAVPHDGERPQHLFLLARTSIGAQLDAYLQQGGRSVHGWLDTVPTRIVPAADIADSFRNINTLTELGEASATLPTSSTPTPPERS